MSAAQNSAPAKNSFLTLLPPILPASQEEMVFHLKVFVAIFNSGV